MRRSRRRGLPIARECGECTACCSLMGVDALAKCQGEDCAHADKGCEIYEDRPSACREYSCEWKRGRFKDSERPDRIGIVVDDGNDPRYRQRLGADAVVVRETFLDSERSERQDAMRFVGRIGSEGGVIVLVPHPRSASQKRKLMCADPVKGKRAFMIMENFKKRH